MEKRESLEQFQREIFLEAIFVVEQNDYMGLLVNKAKLITDRNGESFNNETATDILAEIEQVLIKLVKYRKLNQMLYLNEHDVSSKLLMEYDKYFKSRITSAKLATNKLYQFL